jgi:hypothetical protein
VLVQLDSAKGIPHERFFSDFNSKSARSVKTKKSANNLEDATPKTVAAKPSS